MYAASRLPVWVVPTILALALTAFLLGYKVHLLTTQDLPAEEMSMFRRVYHRVMTHHITPQDGRELILKATAGMVDGLDRYSQFVPPDAVARFEQDTVGTYRGIGVLLVRDRAPVTVLFPFTEGPAARAGLLPGDMILAVDGTTIETEPVKGILERARARILGPAGTKTILTVRRSGGEPFDVEVERAKVHQASVQWTRIVDEEARIGYLHISDFQEDTVKEFDAEMAWLQQQADGPVRALIVDLRGNSGGLLKECLSLTNRFLKDGTIITVRGRRGPISSHDADPKECTFPDLPLVILQNASSASASEVMAGALQDRGRALIVGERSFGKGMVQSIFSWEDPDYMLKLTTQEYETPSGRKVEGPRTNNGADQKGGIVPDRLVELSRDAERTVFRVLGMEVETPRPYRAQAKTVAEEVGLSWPEPVGPEVDTQLATAITTARELLKQSGR